MSTQVILIPAAHIQYGLPDRELLKAAEIRHDTRIWFKRPKITKPNMENVPDLFGRILFFVDSVPDKVTYEDKWSDFIPIGEIQSNSMLLASALNQYKITHLFLPESGLASVPMKNVDRIRNDLQARYNSMIINALRGFSALQGVYLRLSLGGAYLELKSPAELSL